MPQFMTPSSREYSDLQRERNELLDRVDELLAAMKMILAEPYGCPMCDSGKLRNPAKEHWDTCGFARAVSVIAKTEGRP